MAVPAIALGRAATSGRNVGPILFMASELSISGPANEILTSTRRRCCAANRKNLLYVAGGGVSLAPIGGALRRIRTWWRLKPALPSQNNPCVSI